MDHFQIHAPTQIIFGKNIVSFFIVKFGLDDVLLV